MPLSMQVPSNPSFTPLQPGVLAQGADFADYQCLHRWAGDVRSP